MSDNRLLPKVLPRVKSFDSRQVYTVTPTGPRHDPRASDPALDVQINTWIDMTHVKVVAVSSPAVNVYASTSEAGQPLEIRFFTTAVSYLPLVEPGDTT